MGMVLDVLGLSVDFLWRKLGEHLPEEKVAAIREHLDTLGGVWSFIKDVQERGIVAIWEYVQSQLSTLWETILEIAMKWILETLVVQGTIKLLAFLDPTFIMSIVNGCIAFYEGVMSTIEYIREILEIIDLYVSTIASVARGDIAPGAQMVERGFAAAVPVAIGFLAAQLGLGNIPNKIAEIILGIREVVEAAIDWLIEQALKLGASVLDALTGDSRAAQDHVAVPDAESRDPAIEGDATKIPQGLPPEAIKTEALARVEGLFTGQRFGTPKEFSAAVALILDMNRDRGLRGLDVRVTDEQTMDIEVGASASARRARVIRWADVFSVGSAPDPAEFASQGMGTIAAISVDGTMVGTVSRSKGAKPEQHAEWLLVDGLIWHQAIEAVKHRPPGARVERVVLAINRAPCQFCAGHVTKALTKALNELETAGVHQLPAFVLAPTGTYEPPRVATSEEIDRDVAQYAAEAQAKYTGQARIDTYVDRRTLPTRLDRTKATTMQALRELAVAGWDLRALQVLPELKPFGIELAEAAHRLAQELGRP
jgi:hypothetical protein